MVQISMTHSYALDSTLSKVFYITQVVRHVVQSEYLSVRQSEPYARLGCWRGRSFRSLVTNITLLTDTNSASGISERRERISEQAQAVVVVGGQLPQTPTSQRLWHSVRPSTCLFLPNSHSEAIYMLSLTLDM